MLSRLVALCLSQRLLVLVLTTLLAALGLWALRTLPIDAFPDISSTQVKIIMKAPGMTPEEVETRITGPIEQELLGIPGQTILRSKSKYAIADITLDFEDGTDIYWARQQVSERLAGVVPNLPTTASGGLAPISTPLSDMFMFTVEGPQSLEEKRTVLDWVIRPQLRGLPGVADVNSLGGHVRSYEVVPDIAALSARGLTLGELHDALMTNNRSDGAGRLQENEESWLIRADGDVRSPEDLAGIVVATRGGIPVRVADVATVRIGALTRYGMVTQAGTGEAVEGLVIGLRGANAQQVVESVRERLAQIAPTLPKGMHVSTFYDRGSLVERAISNVSHALGEAAVLVLVLLFLFLGNVRAAVAVILILPLAALATFLAMRLQGLSANLMSLGGLAIAIGMLVDAAVVVVENIEAHQSQPGAERHSRLHVIYRATAEVAVPVTAGIAIIALVFLPLLSLQGLEGKLFKPVAITIVFALLGSLLLSLTIVPVAATWLLKGSHSTPRLVAWLESRYRRLLEWALRSERTVFIAAGAALVAAMATFMVLGKSFMPTMDEGDVVIQHEKLPSIGLSRSAATDMEIQKAVLQEVPEVERFVARVGSDELGLDPMGTNETDGFVKLKPRDQWRRKDKAWVVDQVRAVTDRFPGVNTSFTQPIEMRVSELISGVRGDLAVKLFGPDLATLGELARRIAGELEQIQGSEDVNATQNDGVQYLQISLDRGRIGRAGLDVEAVQNDLRSLVEGRQAGVVVESGRRLPLLLRGPLAATEGGGPDNFAQLRLPVAEGNPLPLAELARLERTEGPVKIERENGSRMAVIRSNVRDRDLVGFVDEARARIAKNVPLPTGYHLTFGGQFENQQRTAARLGLVVPVALALIFLLLFATFTSVRQALLVFVNIPLALVGGVFALAVTREYVSVPASVGFIALMGIAVLNGLVMISYFNQLRARGMQIEEVVREGAVRRLRPVLMTASITAFGLVPLLFATGPGSEIQKPLAVVVIGGLVSSTALTLVLLPSLFRRFGVEK
ncbi:MAG TPA: CusA/CzcA family heavy metal efflux RND transporter [Steroidobacteraceae bacterium]|nr:CusA/CzcA family heavy metal efflux RND transporter [Steroidobacteraceae bacterium]